MCALAAVAACSANEPPAAATAAAALSTVAGLSIAAGERIYAANCVPCHQQGGQGIPGVYPAMSGSAVVLGNPKELARWVIKGQRPASMPAGRYPSVMLQFGWMKPADAAALFCYLRTNFGNAAAPVDAATVEQAL